MGCLKGKKAPADKAKYTCKKCGGTAESKKNICKPKKIKCKHCKSQCCKKDKEKKLKDD